jgi:DHA1 family bicyclomycin/chloramphenicol resistance-like MFS transporter
MARDPEDRGQVTSASVPEPSRPLVYGVAIGLFVYGWLSVNIYLPILLELEDIFQIRKHTASLTVTVFLIGFSFTQLAWGPLSDRFGRRPVLLCGLVISVIGATLTGFTSNIYQFMGARFLESIGLGVGPVLARSVLTDSLDRIHVTIAMAYVAAVVAVVPAIAPIVGGYLNILVSWRGIFFFLALYGTALLTLCAFRLPETIGKRNPGLRAAHVAAEYWQMLSNRRYFGYVSAYAIAFGTLIGYYVMAPYIFVRVLGYTAHEYGYLLLVNVVFYVLGVSGARVFVSKTGTDRLIVFAIIGFAIASILFVALEFLTTINAISVLLPMSVFIFASGLVSPAANTGAMTLFRDRAGASTAIIGFSIAIGGAIFSGALSVFHITRLVELGTYVGISTVISIAIYLIFLRQRNTDAGSQSV